MSQRTYRIDTQSDTETHPSNCFISLITRENKMTNRNACKYSFDATLEIVNRLWLKWIKFSRKFVWCIHKFFAFYSIRFATPPKIYRSLFTSYGDYTRLHKAWVIPNFVSRVIKCIPNFQRNVKRWMFWRWPFTAQKLEFKVQNINYKYMNTGRKCAVERNTTYFVAAMHKIAGQQNTKFKF